MAALAGHVRSCAIRNLRKTFGAKKKKRERKKKPGEMDGNRELNPYKCRRNLKRPK